MKLDKNPAENTKIPYPIKLEEESQIAQVLRIRKDQLELALHMGEWTDAHRISGNIYQLILKVGKKQSDQQLKDLYIEFFGNLSNIFWESELYLFHTYALQCTQYYIKSQKSPSLETVQSINDKFVLAALSIPLNNKLSSFERLSFNYQPEYVKSFQDVNPVAKLELKETAKMLQVEGFPSRESLIHSIQLENI